jgi:hypothetical protein
MAQIRRHCNRIEDLARKADLLAFAIDGLMAVHDNDEAWPLRDCAHELNAMLRELADEARL